MTNVNIGRIDNSNSVDDYIIAQKQTDGISNLEETTWVNTRWPIQWGYFNAVPDLKAAIISKAIWDVGKGYTTDADTQVILDNIQGWGKESFNEVIFNMDVVSMIGGDSFAEIIRDETGELVNLKPLDPSSIRIVVDGKGIIKRYEQITKLGNSVKVKQTFKPEEILHFSRDRFADQIHGISVIDALEQTILADEESFQIGKDMAHYQLMPFIIWKLKTDDPAKMAAVKSKIDEARRLGKGKDVFIPDDDDTVSFEVVQINPASYLLEWRNEIRKRFYRGVDLPELLPSGGGDSTESGGKIGYYSFSQVIEHPASRIEQALWNQLQLKIDFYRPESLGGNLNGDQAKDPSAFQQSDITAGSGR